MPAILNTNMASLYAQKNLSTAQADLASSVQKLSSGKRINSAKDDAAGYAVAEAVKATKNVTDQSIQNTQDAISLVQTAEGALDVMGKILQRVLTLTTQKENGSLTDSQKTSINNEIASLLNETAEIKKRTKFQGAGESIFGRVGAVGVTESGTDIPDMLKFSTGDNSTTTISIADLSLLDATSTTSNLGLVSASAGADATAKATAGKIDFADAADATAGTLVAADVQYLKASVVMTAVQKNIDNRANLGTWQTRLNFIVDNMQTLSNNLADAQSRIIDTDYASETAKLTRGQILQQAATSMLAQANQMPNVILTLLK
ncbi:flagellin FliC [Polynucleobacter sp. 30F-ANTBAC]|uniref:flagellin N-terminal helical domain-containing protein n=1 Tax=Polynucleobacter sp. 30F-ANTBAC TaxID=2689095 RepID=UPI001C0B3291|nr:flagellin [Polynucleobacter sp. 30F-ANTBAC]MBU3599780.1 flagellin FliC [Polynucleobacter sp. 30F-ANTBAC]